MDVLLLRDFQGVDVTEHTSRLKSYGRTQSPHAIAIVTCGNSDLATYEVRELFFSVI